MTTSPRRGGKCFPENKKPLNGNFDIKFSISLKATLTKLIRNIATC